MKRYFGILSVPCLLILTLLPACKPAVKNGSEIYFNSSNFLKYWNINKGEMNGDSIILSEKNAFLCSSFNIKNFRLVADVFTDHGAEGAIYFHIPYSDSLSNGYSVIINNTDYLKGSIQKTGSLALIRNNFIRMVPENKWFTMEISVKANVIQVFINGKPVVDYTEPDNPVRIDALKNRVLSEGLISIRKNNETGSIQIRNLKLHALKEEEVENKTVTYDSIDHYIMTLNQTEFPLIDFHVHLKGGLTVDQVCEHAHRQGYNIGISPNCGLNFPVTNDSSLLLYFTEMEYEPAFRAMQCEGREWVTLFSPDVITKFDYIFTDAMTWTDHKGRRLRLWIPEETFVENEQQFMDMLVTKIEAEISQEPVDIYVNPTYLPEKLNARYNELWTEERMDRVIKVLKENDVALEINSRFRIPSLAFIVKAKKAGLKFTMGTNNAGNDDLGRLEYGLQMIKEAGLTASEMFIPRPSDEKKVIKKGLPSKITG